MNIAHTPSCQQQQLQLRRLLSSFLIAIKCQLNIILIASLCEHISHIILGLPESINRFSLDMIFFPLPRFNNRCVPLNYLRAANAKCQNVLAQAVQFGSDMAATRVTLGYLLEMG